MHRLFWALLVLFLFAALLRQNWIYYLLYLVGGVWIFSHWWIRRVLSKLTARRHMLLRAFAGEYIDIRLEVNNGSWLPVPWLKVAEQAPLELKDQPNYHMAISLGGRSSVDYRYRFLCKRRGYYPIGPLLINAGDLFGFSGLNWQERQPPHVTVYPQIVTLDRLGLPSRSPFGTIQAHQRLFEDPVRMTGVRDYAVGDSLRHVHWKASAHEDKLLVKKFQPAIALNVTVVLDLARASYAHVQRGIFGYSEWSVTVAASVAAYVARQRQPVGLITNGHDPRSGKTAFSIPAHHGAGQLMSVLDLLARIELNDAVSDFAEWLPEQIRGLAWGGTLVVVTPLVSDELLWVLHDAHRRGASITVLACAPQRALRTTRARANQLGITVYRSVWEDDLKKVG